MRLLVLLLAIAACGTPGDSLRDWTLSTGTDATAVRLPGHLFFDLPRRELDYTLHTRIAIAAQDLDQPLSLIVPCYHGELALLVDGKPAVDLGDVGVGEHRFLIAATHGTPVLTLVAHRDNLSTVGFGVAPYLSHDPVSTRGTIAAFNRTAALIEAGVLELFGLLYLIMWLLGRRPEDGAFVVVALAAATAPLWQLGMLPMLFGPFAASAPAFALSISQIAVLYFMHHAFGIPAPPRGLVRAFQVIAALALTIPLHFLIGTAVMAAVGAVTVFYVLFLLKHMLLLARHPERGRDGKILLGIMLTAGSGVLPDIVWLLTGHNLLGGIHTISAGLVGMVLTQAILLSRAHVARLRQLERQADELRRQVAERSRELTVALAELARRPPEQLSPDRIIGNRYKILRRLGAGGMGTVYEVLCTDDNRRLALKTLRSRAEPDVMARFTREAQIAAELSHPNLVPVLDVGVADGLLYLVMPLISGGSLEQLRAKFGDAAWARPFLAEIATGLAALHVRGIVHRDLKPGNVLCAPAAQIADFGLAALDDKLGDTALSLAANDSGTDDTLPAVTPSPPLTRAGDIFGTPRYMAPELATGADAANPASDVFALGVMAFEMLTGHQPFPDSAIVLRMNGERIPAPSLDLVAGPYRDLVGRLLAIDPAARPTAAEAAAGFAR